MQRSINIFDKLGSLIPGYRGYAERNNRRQSERILRDSICHVLESCERTISEKTAADLKIKKYTQVEEFEDCRKKINTLHDRIQYAPYGESAFFSNEQLKEDELLKIYQIDLTILEKANTLKIGIPSLDLPEVILKIQEIERSFDARNEFIKEYK